MELSLIISIIATVATVISTSLAIKQSLKVKKLRREKHRLTWEDIEIAINDLFKNIEKEFQPEVVVCLSERGTAIVTMGFSVFGRNLPIFTGFWSDEKKTGKEEQVSMTQIGFRQFTSRGRQVYIPEAVFSLKGKRILVIDDWVFTGQAMNNCNTALLDAGIKEEDLCYASLVASPAGIQSLHWAPRFYYHFEFADNKFSFPWGRAS